MFQTYCRNSCIIGEHILIQIFNGWFHFDENETYKMYIYIIIFILHFTDDLFEYLPLLRYRSFFCHCFDNGLSIAEIKYFDITSYFLAPHRMV